MADYRLTEEGLEYLNNGLPEKNLADLLSNGPVSFEDARNKIKNFNIALQWLKKARLIDISKGEIRLTKNEKFESHEQIALEKIHRGGQVTQDAEEILLHRNLIKKISHEVENLEKSVEGKEIEHLTPEMIKTGAWKRAKGFLPYSDSRIRGWTPVVRRFQGKLHPYRQILNELRDKLVGMGFIEARGPYVESEFWNFDALFVPQEHPARSGLHDSFVVKTSSQSKIEDRDMWDRVKATHEFGWTTGSSGWGSWSASLARRLILRSQNTATSARTLASLEAGSLPHKMFSIDRVFRHDVIDSRHLIDFDQLDCIVVGEGLNFRHLLGYLNMIGKAIGARSLRFKPSYFPFTEPSAEIYAEIEGHGWVEIGGAGILRPEVTVPLGIEVPVLAWAFGIGRLAMIKLGITDIRQLYSEDVSWLREKSLVK